MSKAPNLIDRQVGEQVSALRIESGVLENEAAFVADVSLVEYRQLEAGTKRFKAVQLIELARKFKVSPTAFFDNVELTKRTVPRIVAKRSELPSIH